VDGAAVSEPDRQRLERLEAENRALRRVNAKLMRDRLGSSNTAAAGQIAGPARARPGRLWAAVRAPLARTRLALRRLALRVLR